MEYHIYAKTLEIKSELSMFIYLEMIKLLIDDNELGFMRAETIKRNKGIVFKLKKKTRKSSTLMITQQFKGYRCELGLALCK